MLLPVQAAGVGWSGSSIFNQIANAGCKHLQVTPRGTAAVDNPAQPQQIKMCDERWGRRGRRGKKSPVLIPLLPFPPCCSCRAHPWGFGGGGGVWSHRSSPELPLPCLSSPQNRYSTQVSAPARPVARHAATPDRVPPSSVRLWGGDSLGLPKRKKTTQKGAGKQAPTSSGKEGSRQMGTPCRHLPGR